jgi:hypothetical protein
MKLTNTSVDKQTLIKNYNNSRANLLLVVVFTVINIILLITQSNTYFLFSTYIPYALVTVGMMLCGMFPPEFYEGLEQGEFLGQSAFYIFLGIALIFVVLYLLCWIFSKNNKSGWLIFALVLFSADTLGMFAFQGLALDGILDVAFHIWVIVSLVMGISACSKLKKISQESDDNEQQEQIDETIKTEPIRTADTYVKSRILIETEAFGHVITYRRVKRVNELVIDGNVYDEHTALVEFAHSLKANIDGHIIEAGFDGIAHSYLKIDGELVAQKVRIV